jgi:hypothetical protein
MRGISDAIPRFVSWNADKPIKDTSEMLLNKQALATL